MATVTEDPQRAQDRLAAINQIPSDGYPKAPAADGSQNSALNTDVGRNAVNSLAALPGAGPIARGAAKVLPGVASAVGASSVVNTLAKVGPYAIPGGGAFATMQAAQAEKPQSPSLTPQVQAPAQNQTPAAQAVAAPPPAPAQVPELAPQPATAQTTPDGGKVSYDPQTKTYSGGVVGPNAVIEGGRGGGAISAQNMAAANALADQQAAESMARVQSGAQTAAPVQAVDPAHRATEQLRSMLDLRSPEYLAARSLAMEAASTKSNLETSAQHRARTTAAATQLANLQGELLGGVRSAQTSQDQFASQQQIAQTQARSSDARTAMQELGANLRATMQNDVARGDLAIKQTDAAARNRATQRLEALQYQYAKASPADRPALAEQIRVMSGKERTPTWKAVALQGGTDAMGNKQEAMLGAVNEVTGEMTRMDMPKPNSIAPGTVRNGYKFKGGDPAQQKNWEKA